MPRSITEMRHPLWVEIKRRNLTQIAVARAIGMPENSYLNQMLTKARPMPAEIEAAIRGVLREFDQGK
jgi:hypothetical protein